MRSRPTASSSIRTPVGDRNVLDELERRNLVLGGEQSGHIINALHATTGDGALTGILLLDTMCRRRRPLSELAAVMVPVPQVLRNVEVADPALLERRRHLLEPGAGASSRSSAATAGCSCAPRAPSPWCG